MNIYNRLKSLEEENPEYKHYRYFDSDGSPYDCDTFLIGINPANGLPFDKEFWDYCDDENGFDLKKWIGEYQQERSNNKKTKISATRNRIEKLRLELHNKDHRLLNCNIYSKNTPRLKDLENQDRNIDIFRILITELQPKKIILHGGITKKVFEKVANGYSSDSPDWELQTIHLNHQPVIILSVPHLFNMALTPEKNKERNIQRIADLICT